MIPAAQSVCDDLAQAARCCRRANLPIPQDLLDRTAALCARGLTVAPETEAHNATDASGRWWAVKGIVPGLASQEDNQRVARTYEHSDKPHAWSNYYTGFEDGMFVARDILIREAEGVGRVYS